jgi:hypothetical protein
MIHRLSINFFLKKRTNNALSLVTDDALHTFLDFNHKRSGGKSSRVFFALKDYFLIYFHLKIPNKRPYNLNKVVY